MTFLEYWNEFNVTHIWLTDVGNPTGVDLVHGPEADLSEWVYENDWIHDLKGSRDGMGRWVWDGEGDPRHLTNSVLKLVALTPSQTRCPEPRK